MSATLAERRESLRIGIDATCLGTRRGYGRYLRQLLPPLLDCDPDNEYVLFADRHTEVGHTDPRIALVRPPTSTAQGQAASAHGHRSLRDAWLMGRAVTRERLDLMYFPTVYSYFPVPGRVPVAVGFHDTIAERHAGIVFPSRRTRWLWKAKVGLARRQARALIAVSEWSRRSLADWFGIPPEQIFVTLEAPAPVFQPSADAGPRRAWLRQRGLPPDAKYLIYVGGFNPHKNLAPLVDVFAALDQRPSGGALHLLLVGDHEGDVFHAEVETLRRRIRGSGVGDRIHWTGFVEDAELRHLYAGALALLLPSLEEGFGLPAVEAAACATPCVATRCSPLPELLEGGGLFVDPGDPAALRRALERLLAEPSLREVLGRRALEGARKLSWRATAEATRRALEAIAGAGPHGAKGSGQE